MRPPKQWATINVGKNGLTPEVLEEIRFLLKKKGRVRVKFLKSFMEEAKQEDSKKGLFSRVALHTGGTIEKAVGFVLVLRK